MRRSEYREEGSLGCLDWKLIADLSLDTFDKDDGSIILPSIIDSIATCNLKNEFPGLVQEPGALKVLI
ncbi:unnamed protein product [Lepeophtheirus salmonis]|uniref:(salmon louse) hypothetical protein n=1 Tax=Lepeophtheirus salmonis TaxID=72036 RepID=A0A7R8CSM3_LEPSM|nr:unnamed protein product [Lepeophtheirus salmonis]CAF2918281.1 unnamed protein product [Lepeophtheirus salmonis]